MRLFFYKGNTTLYGAFKNYFFFETFLTAFFTVFFAFLATFLTAFFTAFFAFFATFLTAFFAFFAAIYYVNDYC